MTHGRRASYIRGCRCVLCTAANRDYQRKRASRRRSNQASTTTSEEASNLAWLNKSTLVQYDSPEAAAAALAARAAPEPTRRLVVLDQVFELVRCEPLDSDLTVSACTKRWRIANAHVKGSGTAAMERSRLEACAGCEVGEARTAKSTKPKE